MPVITNSLSGVSASSAKLLDNTDVTLSFDASTSNQIVTLADNTYTNKVTIAKPNTLVPDNIKAGIVVAGITGTYAGSSGTTTLKALLDATKSTVSLFRFYSGSTIEGLINKEDTSNVTDMTTMFYNCLNLTIIPQLNTSNVVKMESMFAGCSNLTTIPQLDTSNVTTMQMMFRNCSRLSSIPLLDTRNVASVWAMFQSCTSLITIPLLDISKIQYMQEVFAGCTSLTTIPALDVSNVKSFIKTFTGCTSLKSILMTGMAVSFDISASTQFETDDLVTILNNLATVTTSQTLTMGATNLAKLSDEQKKIATDKGWTLA